MAGAVNIDPASLRNMTKAMEEMTSSMTKLAEMYKKSMPSAKRKTEPSDVKTERTAVKKKVKDELKSFEKLTKDKYKIDRKLLNTQFFKPFAKTWNLFLNTRLFATFRDGWQRITGILSRHITDVLGELNEVVDLGKALFRFGWNLFKDIFSISKKIFIPLKNLFFNKSRIKEEKEQTSILRRILNVLSSKKREAIFEKSEKKRVDVLKKIATGKKKELPDVKKTFFESIKNTFKPSDDNKKKSIVSKLSEKKEELLDPMSIASLTVSLIPFLLKAVPLVLGAIGGSIILPKILKQSQQISEKRPTNILQDIIGDTLGLEKKWEESDKYKKSASVSSISLLASALKMGKTAGVIDAAQTYSVTGDIKEATVSGIGTYLGTEIFGKIGGIIGKTVSKVGEKVIGETMGKTASAVGEKAVGGLLGRIAGGFTGGMAGRVILGSLGSLIAPGIGTAIGGVVGGIIGPKIANLFYDKLFNKKTQIGEISQENLPETFAKSEGGGKPRNVMHSSGYRGGYFQMDQDFLIQAGRPNLTPRDLIGMSYEEQRKIFVDGISEKAKALRQAGIPADSTNLFLAAAMGENRLIELYSSAPEQFVKVLKEYTYNQSGAIKSLYSNVSNIESLREKTKTYILKLNPKQEKTIFDLGPMGDAINEVTQLSGLVEPFRTKVAKAFDMFREKYGRFPRITSARRTTEQQAAMYNDYLRGLRTAPTAPPGQSYHEYGMAIDIDTNDSIKAAPFMKAVGLDLPMPTKEPWHWQLAGLRNFSDLAKSGLVTSIDTSSYAGIGTMGGGFGVTGFDPYTSFVNAFTNTLSGMMFRSIGDPNTAQIKARLLRKRMEQLMPLIQDKMKSEMKDHSDKITEAKKEITGLDLKAESQRAMTDVKSTITESDDFKKLKEFFGFGKQPSDKPMITTGEGGTLESLTSTFRDFAKNIVTSFTGDKKDKGLFESITPFTGDKKDKGLFESIMPFTGDKKDKGLFESIMPFTGDKKDKGLFESIMPFTGDKKDKGLFESIMPFTGDKKDKGSFESITSIFKDKVQGVKTSFEEFFKGDILSKDEIKSAMEKRVGAGLIEMTDAEKNLETARVEALKPQTEIQQSKGDNVDIKTFNTSDSTPASVVSAPTSPPSQIPTLSDLITSSMGYIGAALGLASL